MQSLPRSPRDLRVHALASGSSGNAFLVQAGETNLLLDAGLPLKTLRARLSRHGVGARDLHGVLLTHEHHDHSSGVGAIARNAKAPVLANAATLRALSERDALPFLTRELPTGAEVGIGEIGVRSFLVPHDAAEPVGFVLTCGGSRVCYMTDTGCVTPAMREALAGASLAVVEANHDLEWLRRGPYSPEMKARVESDLGHLSNADCAALLAERLEGGGPLCVWLAHLSRVNNSPSLARRSVGALVRSETRVPFTLEIALRDHASLSWRAGSGAVQLSLL